MLVDSYAEEDVFARVPEVAAQTDPVLRHLDRLLDDDLLCWLLRISVPKQEVNSHAETLTTAIWNVDCKEKHW